MRTVYYAGQAYQPSKIVCAGRNYVAHAEELGNDIPEQLVLFLKPNSAIGDAPCIPVGAKLHYEAELCFLVRDSQLAAIGLGLDLTLRDLQAELKSKGLPWERAKAFDGAALFSEFIALDETLDDYRLELHINGVLKQSGGVAQMMYKPQAFLAEVQDIMTLEEGDILMTGTPAGVGALSGSDRLLARLYHRDRLLLEQEWQARRAPTG